MLDILNTTKQAFSLDKKKIEKIQKSILGNNYELSIVIVGDKKSQNLNKKFRNKDYPTNVLSFPYDKNSGEIFFNIKKAKTEAKDFEMSTINFLYYLLIHSMLHLKGLEHGDKMDTEEEKLLKKFLDLRIKI